MGLVCGNKSSGFGYGLFPSPELVRYEVRFCVYNGCDIGCNWVRIGAFKVFTLLCPYSQQTGALLKGLKIASNAVILQVPGFGVVFFSSGSGLTADSSVLTLTLAFLDFGLDFAQSFPFHAQFCHFGLVFCLFDDIHFLHNTNAKQTYIWQFLSVFGHLSSFLEIINEEHCASAIGEGLIIYQAYGNLYATTGSKAHLLEDKKIPSVWVFDEHLEEIHMTWVHFGKKRTRLQLYTKVDEEIAHGLWRRRQKYWRRHRDIKVTAS
ncbi:hypothetical protein Tco_0774888 [Tanacetum coccineum]|uniref:Uncharacterized protein n=1 Tax=Tanacetum coccineum TaxID=301880 RepID=A0ABQ4ZQQ4_9ASTR